MSLNDLNLHAIVKKSLKIQSLSFDQLNDLAQEIRQKILEVVAKTGGHLASNLGIIELTIALHHVFESPKDKFIFDTSHQVYTHKILTERDDLFETLRQYQGISGFSHPPESIHDNFFCGHAGTALSLSLGVAQARDFQKETYHVIPILGDATLNCGLTLEALNNVPKDLSRFLVILNDNEMSISKNVGHISKILSRLLNNPISTKVYREIYSILAKIPAYGKLLAKSGQKISESIRHLVSPSSFFEQFGLHYIGPIDGHDIKKLSDTLSALKHSKWPVLVHVLTKKGKGLNAAIKNPTRYHGAKPFDISTGNFLSSFKQETSFPQIFGEMLIELAKNDPTIFALTPAMLSGSCLSEFMKQFPNRCFDVGIAEGHCITFSGGLAYNQDIKVFCVIYSTFLQRAFDNIFHDICLQNIPVIFGIDRAGINGPDGVTHHGIYDIGFLNAMPNLVIAQPRNGTILRQLLQSALIWKCPTAIRYPNQKTKAPLLSHQHRPIGKAELLEEGKDVLLLPLGTMCNLAYKIRDLLLQESIEASIVDPMFIKPLDRSLLLSLFSSHDIVVTLEEHAITCGFGSIINDFIIQNQFHHLTVMNFGIPDSFIYHGSNEELLKDAGIDASKIAAKIITIKKTQHKRRYDYCSLSQH